jgi:hypothetical protein
MFYIISLTGSNQVIYDCKKERRFCGLMQLKRHSLLESVVNVTAGYGVALLSQIIIFPLFGLRVSLQDNIQIGLWFTVISLIRSYVLRRVFTKWTEK